MITEFQGKKYERKHNYNKKISACDLCDLNKGGECLYGVWDCISIDWSNYFKEVKEEK